ncbi:MAG: XrtA/PEP-CTERM system histidine kinase PrsK [Pseudomonadota bacterium]
MLTVVAGYSYSIAAVAFLVLFALLLTRWRDRRQAPLLALACFLSALWASMVAYQVTQGIVMSLSTSLLEIVRSAAWSAFLLALLRPVQQTRTFHGFTYRPSAAIVAAAYLVIFAATIISYLSIDYARGLAGLVSGSIGRVALAVMGMLLVENLFKNSAGKERWGIKFACFGIGGLFAYDFYLYVDAILFARINAEIWTARGVVNALIVPLIAVSAARNPQGTVGLAMSRRILFQSVVLVGSAIYLLTMAAAGYYLHFFGGSWGTVMQAAFLFGALILLVTVLASGAFRSWLKVYLSKHFYRYNYDYREEWLRFTRTLSVEGPQLGERVVEAIAELVESPGGVLYLRTESANYEPMAHWNTTETSDAEPQDSQFCQFLKNTQWVVDLQEAETTPEKYEGLTLPQWLPALPKAWLVVPLILHAELLGFVILFRPRSKISLNWEVLDLLKIAGIQAASYLAKQESANALTVARQFETFNRMSTFVVHDLKNLVSQLALVVSNAERHKDSPEFQKDMLETLEHSVQKMRILLQKFNRESSIERPGVVSIDKLLQHAVAQKASTKPLLSLEVAAPGLMVFANATRLERVIGHIIQNALEATARDGQVAIRLMEHNGSAVIELRDTGRGMSETFIRERLFKPFESTKPAGMGIGVFESREYVHELGGKLEVESQLSVGTTFKVTLPLYQFEQESVSSAA